jgi:hypothetical protein
MRRLLALLVTAVTTLAVSIPAVGLLSSSAANAVEQGSVGAAVAPSWQTNATVWRLAYGHGDVWLIGDFTKVRPSGAAAGVNEQSANQFVALSASTGALDTAVNHTHTFTPTGNVLTNGGIAASPDGNTIYVGGTFTAVDGQARNHIAAFNAATGALLPWNPNVNGKVTAIATAGNTVYVGGGFTKSGTVTTGNLAAINATTGTTFANFTPKTNNAIVSIAVTPDEKQVVAGGYFTQVNGLTQSADGTTIYNKSVLLGGESSAAPGVPQSFPAAATTPVGDVASGCNSDVKDVVISNGVAYFANEGTGGGCFDGTWAANLSDGSLVWVNHCLGATQAVQVVGNYLYKGSHAHDCISENTNGDPDNYPQVPENQARHLLSENISNGFLGPWYPFTNAGPNLGPRGMATDGTQLFVGGDFTVINGLGQQGFARFSPTSDYATPKPAAPVAVSSVAGSVNVYAQAPVDYDDTDLTMQLFRDGGTTPVATAQVHSIPSRQPVVGFTDSGLTVGSHHTYTVKAVETNGTGTSPASAASNSVTVSNGSTGYAAAVLHDNPAAYWRLGEASGVIGADSSPNLNGGAYTGAVALGGPGAINDGNTSASFNGSTSYFSSGASQPSPTTFSTEAWFKTTSTSGGKIVGFGSSQTGDSGSYDKQTYMTSDGHIIFGVYNGGFNTVESTGTYNDGAWHQVVATQGSSGMALFVDGKKVGSNLVTTNQSFNGFWRVGEDNLNGWPSQPASSYFSGSIDDVSVYNAPLTPTQIATHYTAAGYTLPTVPGSTDVYAKAINANGPTLFWRLDQASGTTANDVSGNGNDGTYGSGDTLGVAGAIHDGTTPADTAITTSGNDDGVLVGTTNLPGPSTFSVEGWFKTTHAGGKIIGFGDSSSPTGSSSYDKHVYFNSDGSLNFGVWNGEMDIVTASPSLNLTDGSWHQFVGTQDSTGMKLFIDGNLVGSNGVTTNQGYNGYWHVGGDSGWSDNGNDFAGSLDEIAVYPYALSTSQVSSDYQVGVGTSTGPSAPAAPAAPTVTSSSPTTADVSWTAVSGATTYKVQRAVSGSGSFTVVGTGITGTSFHDTGLTAGSKYDYEVIASNAGGDSSASALSSVTTAPGQPGTLTATAASTSEVDLAWSAAAGTTSYDVQSGPAGSGTFPNDLGAVTTTSFAVTGLNPGDTFDYRVVPQNSGGAGTASNTANGTTLPAKVSGLTATAASATEVDLAWSAATGASTYRVERSPAGAGNWSVLATANASTAFADTTANASTSYDYRVAAVDAGGKGAYSDTQTALTVPGQVTGVNATSTDTSVHLTWTDQGGSTTYEVDRSSTSASSGFTSVATGLASASYTDSAVSATTTYWYRVVASNASGSGAASAVTQVATGTTPPAKVIGLTATSTASSVSLSWTASSDSSATYTVQRSTTSATSGFSSVTTGLTSPAYTDSTVQSSTTYWYRVVANNSGGAGPASDATQVQTLLAAPGKVTGLSASATTTSVALTWTATGGSSATYQVERSTTSATSGFTTLTSTASSPSYTDNTVSANTTYWYRVTATNGAGTGATSDATQVSTPAAVLALKSNSFNGGTNGGALTAANSGGGSGDKFSTTSCAGGAITYSSSAAHGALAARLAPSTSPCYLQWDATAITQTGDSYGRMYVNMGSTMSSTILAKLLDHSYARDAQINLSSTGKITLYDANNTKQSTFTNSVLTGWTRIEWHLVNSTTNGTLTVSMYNADSTTPIETHTVTGINTGANFGALQLGSVYTTTTALSPFLLDDVAYGTAGPLGPAS